MTWKHRSSDGKRAGGGIRRLRQTLKYGTTECTGKEKLKLLWFINLWDQGTNIYITYHLPYVVHAEEQE